MKQGKPPHPGVFIKRVYLDSGCFGSAEITKNLNIGSEKFNRLITQQVSVSPQLASKLSMALGRSPESWLAMQRNYDLWNARSYS